MQTILAVDDAKDTLMLLEFDLQAEGYNVIKVNDGQSALSQLNDHSIDLVLLDLYMPGLSGIETLSQIRANDALSNVPVIMLSASDDEDEIVEALELGAHDYVTKPYIAKVLLARIRNALRLKEKSERLESLAKTDHLTELNNKGHYESLAKNAISQMSRSTNNIAMAMLDIDHFKAVNDTYGHDAGDKVLKFFARMLEATFRDYDILGRVGGEEFAVCMPNTSNIDAINACERFRAKLAESSIEIDANTSLNITTSIGVASAQHQDCGYDFTQLMLLADQFLYQAKEQSRNAVISHFIDENTVEQAVAEKSREMSENNEKLAGIDYQIGVNNVLGDENLFKEILQMFYDDHHQDGDNIQQAISNEDHARLKSLVHTLKGVACSIGAMDLFEKTKQLDIAVNENKSASYQNLFDNVAYELERVVSGIKTELGI